MYVFLNHFPPYILREALFPEPLPIQLDEPSKQLVSNLTKLHKAIILVLVLQAVLHDHVAFIYGC